MRDRLLSAAVVGLITALGILPPTGTTTDSAAANSVLASQAVDRRPSIVLVVMDDFSMDLLSSMRHAETMRRTGAFYRHSYVVDSQCCPSRASLLTGQYPHQTRVLSNSDASLPETGPVGGFAAFRNNGNLERSVNVQLQASGYTTGFVGKYLNGYGGGVRPPGWSTWRAIIGDAYDGWGFRSTTVRDGVLGVREHPAPPRSASDARKDRAYAGRVANNMALSFLRSHRDDPRPYFLEVAPYGVHSRIKPSVYRGDPLFPPAFRDRREGSCGQRSCGQLDARDLPGFGDPQSDNRPRYADGQTARQWRHVHDEPSANVLTRDLRNRAQMAQSIDRMLARILETVDPNTYVVLTSDNGFHLGQHRLGRGKGTPFTSDVRVPLLIVGPGVRPGVRTEVVSNIDLAPTFEDLAGLSRAPYRSGQSLVPTFARPKLDRRDTTFIEHTSVASLDSTGDPDVPFDSAIEKVPSYVAVRTRKALLVRFDLDRSWTGVRYAWEFYDFTHVGWERTNHYGSAKYAGLIDRLTHRMEQFDTCSSVVRDDAVPVECRSLTQ
ncbi:MAG: sulfatase-like hydrolase/transferase [Nocardioides sp.]